MGKGGEGILGRAGVKPRFGGQNAMFCSDSLVEITPQQVEDDRQGRVRRVHRIGSLGWEHVGISPEECAKGMVNGTTKGYLTVWSGMLLHTHTPSRNGKHQWEINIDKYCTFFLSNSTINFILNLNGRRSIDSSTEGCKARKKELTVIKMAKIASVSSHL